MLDSQLNHEEPSVSRDGVWTQPWVISSSKISKVEIAKLPPMAGADVAFWFMDVAEGKNNKIDCETPPHPLESTCLWKDVDRSWEAACSSSPRA